MNDRETPNPFTNCKVESVESSPDAYTANFFERGDKNFPVSRSMLMAFVSCPAKWRAGWTPKDTDSTEWGSLIDCMVLTPGEFEKRFVLQPATYPATRTSTAVKEGKAKKGDPIPWNATATYCKQWAAKNDGKQVVTEKERVRCLEALNTLKADERCKTLIDCSARQVLVTGQYQDRDTGIAIPVKCLIDLVPHKSNSKYGRSLADLKTTRSAHPSSWQKSVHQFGYDAQAAMCLWLYSQATGEDRNTFYHILQENSHPWTVARRFLSVEFMELGRVKVLNALKRYCRCLKTNTWPNWDDFSQYDGWSIVEPTAYMMEVELAPEPEEEQDEEQPTHELSDQLN